MSGKPTFEVLARAAAQLAAIDEFALELEVPINADDQQLLEVALALNQHLVAGLFGRDGLDLNTLAVNRAVRARRVGRMAAQTKLNLCVDFSQFAPDLKVAAGVLEMPLGAVDQVLEDFRLLQDAERKPLSAPDGLN